MQNSQPSPKSPETSHENHNERRTQPVDPIHALINKLWPPGDPFRQHIEKKWFDFAGAYYFRRYATTALMPWHKTVIRLRDNNKCRYCGKTDSLVIDHIWPVCRGGSNEPDNLQTLCWQCNTKKNGHIDQHPLFNIPVAQLCPLLNHQFLRSLEYNEEVARWDFRKANAEHYTNNKESQT